MRRLLLFAVFALVSATPGALARSETGPTNTTPPTIVGTPHVGVSLSAQPGTWSGAVGTIAFSYAWVECDPQGNGCMPLPYTTHTIASLNAVVGRTVRVVVTATDTVGSATATSAPAVVQGANGGPSGGPAPKLTLISPRAGSIVHEQRFPVVVNAVGQSGKTLRVTLEYDRPGATLTKKGSPGRFRFYERVRDAGVHRFGVRATSAGRTAQLAFRLTVVPPVTAIQSDDQQLTAPGCRVCVIRDPRGDDLGVPPDIASATSMYANGWLVHTIVAYGTVSAVSHPCLIAEWGPGPHRHFLSAGCFGGPHTGMLFGEGGGCGPHADANDDCGSAHMAFPNSHTIQFRFRPSQIGSPAAYYWDVWVLKPGDQLKDAAPSTSGYLPSPQSHAPYCLVREQLRPQPASSYGFGGNPCSQRLVVAAKP